MILPAARGRDGISVDGVWCHGAFAHTRGIEFPPLADFEPKGAMSTRYNAYRRNEGVSERALFDRPDRQRVLERGVAAHPQPGSRRHPAGAGRHGRDGGAVVGTTSWGPTITVPVDPDSDHLRGPVDAPVTLVEYGDFQCPFCGAAHPVVESVRATMGDDLQFVFRHFPLTTMHPNAEPAAEAPEAAGSQGRFWPMHDLPFPPSGPSRRARPRGPLTRCTSTST